MRNLTGGMLALLAGLAILQNPGSARALVAAPDPLPMRFALAECVVVGKVTALEDKLVSARPFPGAQDKREFKVAVIQIDKALKGAQGLTHIRVGFTPPPAPVAQPGGNIQLIRPAFRGRGQVLTVGQEACFILAPHPEQTFFVIPGLFDVISKKGENFDQEMDLLKRCGKLLEDPLAGLKSKDAEDRLYTAAMLITRYRNPRATGGQAPKTEPVAAEQSKLILQALAEADWSQRNPRFQLAPLGLFFRLGVTDKDGWKLPPGGFKDANQMTTAAKDWLKGHADSYRIQRFVAPAQPE